VKQLFFIFLILFGSCAKPSKNNGAALLPLLLGGNEPQAKAPLSTVEESGNSFTVVSLDSTNPTATNASGDQSSAQQTTTTISTGANTQTTVTAVTNSTPAPSTGGSFNYESNINTNVTVTVTTPSGPVNNAPVVVTENTTSSSQNLVGAGQTNSQGSATVPISVPPTVTQVNVNVVGQNPSSGEGVVISGSVPVQAPSTNNSGTVSVNSSVTLNTNNFQTPQGCLTDIDSDCDGIANSLDFFPNDPNFIARSSSGRYTITFEDNFPRAGDADLNDHVLVFATEMDIAPNNKVKVLRGWITLIGRSTSGSHETRLALQTTGGARLVQKYIAGGNVASSAWGTEEVWNGCAGVRKYITNRPDCLTNTAITKTEMQTGILVMPQSSATLYGINHTNYARMTPQTFVRGVTSYFELTFDTPEDLRGNGSIVNGHLDWRMVRNGGNQVRRAGYETENKTCTIGGVAVTRVADRFIDCNGFPFSVVIPGVFEFQRDGADIRNVNTTGYAKFNSWATSGGTVDRDWYDFVTNRARVVAIRSFYFKQSFTAYLVGSIKQNPWLAGIFLMTIGAGLGYFFKNKKETK